MDTTTLTGAALDTEDVAVKDVTPAVDVGVPGEDAAIKTTARVSTVITRKNKEKMQDAGKGLKTLRKKILALGQTSALPKTPHEP